MREIYTFLILFLSLSAFTQAQEYPTTSWSDSADTSWYNSNQDEFSISSAEDLAGLAMLVEDGNTFEDKTITIDADIDLDGNLWSPIGVDMDLPFSGTVEGNEHSISNLWINLPEADNQGLFGRCTAASLKDIFIDASHILARDTSGTLVGSFSTNSMMTNCKATNISILAGADSDSQFAGQNTGGLIGELTTDSSISNCQSSGDVVGINQIGGLVGTAWDKTEITQCYTEGTVSGKYNIGGLAGYCVYAFEPERNNTINNSFSRASIEAELGRAGGLYGGSDGNLRIKNSYSTGAVTAPEYAGAIIGAWGSDIVVENTYFDEETSGLSDGVGGFTQAPEDYDIEGRTTADMKTEEFVGLLNAGSDEAPWGIDADINDEYPVFSEMLSTPSFEAESLSITVYPTVFDNQLSVSTQLNLASYRMYNINGVLVSQGNFNGNKTITTGNLSAGVYILKINAENSTVTQKVIKN